MGQAPQWSPLLLDTAPRSSSRTSPFSSFESKGPFSTSSSQDGFLTGSFGNETAPFEPSSVMGLSNSMVWPSAHPKTLLN